MSGCTIGTEFILFTSCCRSQSVRSLPLGSSSWASLTTPTNLVETDLFDPALPNFPSHWSQEEELTKTHEDSPRRECGSRSGKQFQFVTKEKLPHRRWTSKEKFFKKLTSYTLQGQLTLLTRKSGRRKLKEGQSTD